MARSFTLITRSRPETSGARVVDGVHKDVVETLNYLHAALVHTCLHKDEPIYSDGCVDHIISELDVILWEIKRISGSIGHLYACKHMTDLGATSDMKKYLNSICDEVDTLHEDIRKFLVANKDRTHDYGHHVYGGIASMRASVCEKVRKMYHDLLKRMHDHNLISRDVHVDLQLV